ncbi:MAG: magnesium transporter [Candidatus Diapherotrites archaeon]
MSTNSNDDNMIDKLQKLQQIKKHELHPLINEIHEQHKISKKTIFYMKEYGPHSNVPMTIIKESTKILIVSTIIASFSGITLEYFKQNLEKIAPLIIVIPAINDMIGDFGTMFSAKISTMLHEGKIKNNPLENHEIKKMLAQAIIIALIGGLLISIGANTIKGQNLSTITIAKFTAIIIVDIIILVSTMFIISITLGKHFFKNKEDPNNFLIPITTSIADLTNIIFISVLTTALI